MRWLPLLALAGFCSPALAQEAVIEIQVLAPDPSFPPQLRLTIQNEAILPFNLFDAMAQSQLLIDGKPAARRIPFKGPAGISAQRSWEGCLPLDDYDAAPAPGKHHLQLKLGESLSNDVTLRWETPVPAARDPKVRLRQVQNLAKAMPQGLPRQCLEFWLREKDGGLQSGQDVRYVVSPDVKVKVRFTHPAASGAESVLQGRPHVYIEKRVMD